MIDKIDLVEKEYLKKDIPEFKPGDEIRVFSEVPSRPQPKLKKKVAKKKEKEERKRMHAQLFQGIVLAKRGSGLRETFVVRKVSYGEGVERTFLLHSPFIKKIEVVKHNKVRRPKLYYLRHSKR
ncbi:MAG: 50S ribosomal protein L19 [Candidatus Omnitrophica bacterium]|nr:50S ribosomal protein L19 [Candidatus Omnitrophota bacterium]